MSGKVLHILSQRPGRTGSGVTLDSLVRQAATAGWHQKALVGVPVTETSPQVGGLPAEAIHTVTFRDDSDESRADLPFPVPGMSDVMPYPSSVWSRLDADELDQYRRVWRERIGAIVHDFKPDVIQTNHIWLMSSLIGDAAPGVPVVAACHATGLRQMELTGHLRDEVIAGCRRIDRFCVLRQDHRDTLADTLGIDPARIVVTGAGYRDDLFAPGPDSDRDPRSLLYVGKYSEAKGLTSLLDAVATLAVSRPGLRLHVAGSGAGIEADQLRSKMEGMAGLVEIHGMLGQQELADRMRRCAVCVLPSFYEGVPLVLVEAAACGCRIVSTDLPGVREQIAPALGPTLITLPLPAMVSIDRPDPAGLPLFTANLVSALESSLAGSAVPPPSLEDFTWEAVFRRVEGVWRALIG